MLENRFSEIGIFILEYSVCKKYGISFGMFSEGGLIGRYFFNILNSGWCFPYFTSYFIR